MIIVWLCTQLEWRRPLLPVCKHTCCLKKKQRRVCNRLLYLITLDLNCKSIVMYAHSKLRMQDLHKWHVWRWLFKFIGSDNPLYMQISRRECISSDVLVTDNTVLLHWKAFDVYFCSENYQTDPLISYSMRNEYGSTIYTCHVLPPVLDIHRPKEDKTLLRCKYWNLFLWIMPGFPYIAVGKFTSFTPEKNVKY